MKRILILLVLSFIFILSCSKTETTQDNEIVINENKEELLYNEIKSLYDKGDYLLVTNRFNSFIKQYSNSQFIKELELMNIKALEERKKIDEVRDAEMSIAYKRENMFEDYYNYQMYNNWQHPSKTHEQVADIIAKKHKISKQEFLTMYSEYYANWYNIRIQKEK